ncbi:MAG: hypothetical protein AB1481_07610 [Candidatus Omnitrophota bacterium]
MRLKRYSKNLAKPAPILKLSLLFCLLFIFGCSSSTSPTYHTENIETSIQSICEKEYKTEVYVKKSGSTLWVYLPVEDLITESDKPEKYSEEFEIENSMAQSKMGVFLVDYSVRSIPKTEKTQSQTYNEEVAKKIGNAWEVLRRIIMSLENNGEAPKFFVLITADIKNGFETEEIVYSLDLKKAIYGLISLGEYRHRVPHETYLSSEIIDDREGRHLVYNEIGLGDFVARQIQHRIKMKFQKPEVDNNADIDKEIIKIVVETLRIYGIKDFSSVELNNLLTQKKIILNQAAIWARPIE